MKNRGVLIDEKNVHRICKIISAYFDTINSLIMYEDTSSNYYHLASILVAIAEYYEEISDKEHWNNIIMKIMFKIKTAIENNLFENILGLYGGLAEVDYAVEYIKEKTGMFSGFSQQIHRLLIERTQNFVDYAFCDFENVSIIHYDLIFGLTGIGIRFLMKNDLSLEEKKLLKDIILYLEVLSGDVINENQLRLPRFYVKSKNQIREDEKRDFPNGNLNFGLAHGMIAPIIFMSKAYKRGIVVHNQKEAIYRILEYYKEFAKNIDSVLYWPTQISVEKFLEKNKNDDYRIRRASWCYGTAGISRGLFLVGKNLNDSNFPHQ